MSVTILSEIIRHKLKKLWCFSGLQFLSILDDNRGWKVGFHRQKSSHFESRLKIRNFVRLAHSDRGLHFVIRTLHQVQKIHYWFVEAFAMNAACERKDKYDSQGHHALILPTFR